MLKLTFHQDAGHGWIAVKRALLVRLNIQNEISGYSYQNGKTVYCEEDCDGTLLLDTLDKNGISYELTRSFKNYSSIRNYNSYCS